MPLPVLVVDDDLAALQTIVGMLQDWGIETVAASTLEGPRGMRDLIARQDFRFGLLDLHVSGGLSTDVVLQVLLPRPQPFKIAFMTAADRFVPPAPIACLVVETLRKPTRVADIRRVLRLANLLDAG